MDMPLLLRIDTRNENTLEFILGKTKKELEKAGIIEATDKIYFRTMYYTAQKTKRINSFFTRKFIGKSITRQLVPGEKVQIKPGEKIGWGEKYPVFSLSYETLFLM